MSFFFWINCNNLIENELLSGFLFHFQVLPNIVIRRNPIIIRFCSKVLRNHVSMNSHSKSSKKFAMITSSDAASLGVQLSEVLNKVNELSVEMVAQRRMIDQLVSSNHGGVQTNHIPNDDNQPKSDNQPTHMSNIQTPSVTFYKSPRGYLHLLQF